MQTLFYKSKSMLDFQRQFWHQRGLKDHSKDDILSLTYNDSVEKGNHTDRPAFGLSQ